MRSNERWGLAVLLLIFCTIAGVFTWNSWKLKNEVLSLRSRSADQTRVIAQLQRELDIVRADLAREAGADEARASAAAAERAAEAPESETSDSIQTSLSAPQLRERIETKSEQLSRLEDESLRASEVINSDIERERLNPLIEAQNRVVQNLDQQIRSLEDQFTVFDVRERTLKDQRQRAWDDEQRLIAQRLQEIEQSIPALQEQIVAVQGRWPAPGWRVGLEIQNLQNAISEQRQEAVRLADRRRQIERESIERRGLPEPDIAVARAAVQQNLQQLQEKKAEETRRLTELRTQVEQVEKRKAEAEAALSRLSEQRRAAGEQLNALELALQRREMGLPAPTIAE